MNLQQLIKERTTPNINITDFRIGDIVRVGYKIKEGDKERIQIFEGRVISIHRDKKSTSSTFTVRKVIDGRFGVERVFPVFSPNIDHIEVIRRSKVRRAKLNFAREKNFRFKEYPISIRAERQPKTKAESDVTQSHPETKEEKPETPIAKVENAPKTEEKTTI